jgi:hypothetical protein
VANNAKTTLSAAIDSSATSLTVTSASRFPTPPFRCVIYGEDLSSGEVVEVGSKAGNTFSNVLRGQEGTTAQSWEAASKIELLYTAGTYEEIRDNVNTKLHYNFGSKSGTATINCYHGSVYEMTLSGSVTISFAKIPASDKASTITLIIHHSSTGGDTVSWGSTVIWGTSAPDFSAASVTTVVRLFITSSAIYGQVTHAGV